MQYRKRLRRLFLAIQPFTALRISPLFFMSTPTIEQVMQDGALVWRVDHGGMTRYFREDWRARWHYEQCIRLSRTKKTGKSG